MAIYQGSKILSSGATPYSFAKENGFEGTEAEFNALLGRIDEAATKEELEAAIAGIPTPDVSAQIGDHNDDTAAHPYIQGELNALNTNLTNQINEQVSGLAATIDANAATAKNYTDEEVVKLSNSIYNELENGSTVVNSANKDGVGNVIADHYESKTAVSGKLDEAKQFATSEANRVKNELLNGAGDAYDTLKELGTLIDENTDAIDALETVAASKVAQTEFDGHAGNVNNPHGVTAAQVGLGNVNNTSDTDKPISTAQATAIADAKAAGTAAQTNLTTHIGASNPHGITASAIGAAPASHTHAAGDVTSGTLSSDRLPTVPITKGGTGATTAAAARTALGAAASSHNHSASNITSGTLSSNRLPTVPIANGGTGATTAAAARTNLGITLAGLGGANVEFKSYVGTGTYGASNPRSLTFSFAPKAIIFLGYISAADGHFRDSSIHALPTDTLTTSYQQGQGFALSGSAEYKYAKKDSTGRTISWYNTYTASSSAIGYQMNTSGSTYYYLAIG